MKVVPRPVAKVPKKDVPKAEVDRQLFDSLGSNHPWRKLSPECARQELEHEMRCIVGDSYSSHRVRTGFVILEKNEIKRQTPLDTAPKLANLNAKPEEASELVASRIANVPATLKTLDGNSTVDTGWISDEIYFTARKEPIQVR